MGKQDKLAKIYTDLERGLIKRNTSPHNLRYTENDIQIRNLTAYVHPPALLIGELLILNLVKYDDAAEPELVIAQATAANDQGKQVRGIVVRPAIEEPLPQDFLDSPENHLRDSYKIMKQDGKFTGTVFDSRITTGASADPFYMEQVGTVIRATEVPISPEELAALGRVARSFLIES